MATVTINGKAFNMPKTNKRKRMSKEDRMVAILISCEVLRRGGRAATVHSVAKHMKYSASTLLRNLMNELTSMKVLQRFEGEHWNGKKRYTYIPDMKFVQENHPVAYSQVIASIGE